MGSPETGLQLLQSDLQQREDRLRKGHSQPPHQLVQTGGDHGERMRERRGA